jgi:biopolymer transport protein ExbD
MFQTDNPYDEFEVIDKINVVPMLDLAWNLLLVFMLTITASVQSISVNLPKASASGGQVKAATKAITITAEGVIYLDSYPVSIEELESRLRQYKAEDPNIPVVVRGDEAVLYKNVVEVLDLLQRLDMVDVDSASPHTGYFFWPGN